MATRFIPITLQVLLGDSKAKISEVRADLGNAEKQVNSLKTNLASAASGLRDKVGSTFSGLRDTLGKAGGGDFLKNLLPSAGAAAGQLGSVEAGLAGVAGGAGLAAGAVAGLAVTLGTATLALAKQAEEIKLTSAVTGLNIQQLQTYQNAAKVTGNSINVLTDGVLQYRERAKEALNGNFELSRSFTKLGVDLKTAVNNPSASFDALLDQLQALPNDVQRVNAIQQIFGETNRELTSIIIALTENQGELRKELQATGTAMNDQAVNDLAKLNREYELLKLRAENLGKRALVDLFNSFRDVIRVNNENTSALKEGRIVTAIFGQTVGEWVGEYSKAPSQINATTTAIQQQAGAVADLNAEIRQVNFKGIQDSIKTRLDQTIQGLAQAGKQLNAQQAKDLIAFNFTADPQFAENVTLEQQRRKNEKLLNDALFPSEEKKPARRVGGGGSGRAKELTELQQLQKQVSEINKDLLGFRNVTSAEFKLRLELEDKRNLKNELEAIIKLRRSLGEPVAVALPQNLPGIEAEKARLTELQKLKELTAKFDPFTPLRESARASAEATAQQFQSLDKLINDALPKVEPATIAAAVAQNELYQSLLRTNPQLAEYYLRQAEAADATIRSRNAAEQFASLQDQLTGQLSQFNNLSVAQATALKLQSDAYKDLNDAQRDQLLGLAQQVDQQNAFRAQIEESQRRVEDFANQLRGIFDRLLDGPKAFFDNLKSTLKRTLSQMLSDLLTSQVLKILGIVPGGAGGGVGAAGFGGLTPALAGANAGGGNPAGQILNQVTGGGNSVGQVLNQATGGGFGKFNLGGLVNKGIGSIGKLFGFGGGATKAASGAVSAAKAATGIGTQAAGAAGSAASQGGFLSSLFGGGGAALFSNPVTAIIGGGLLALPFLTGLFGDRTFNRFRNEVKKAYQIEVDKKQEGRSLFQSAEEIGKRTYGKAYKSKIPELIKLRPVKEQIAQYGIATGQDKASLVRQTIQKEKVSDPDDPQNQIIRREFGGSVRRGDTVLVGERRPEILVPGSDGFVFPSIADYERRLIAALQKRAAGGFFGGAFGRLASQIEAAASSRAAGGASGVASGGADNLTLGVLAELTEVLSGLKAVRPGELVSLGLKESPGAASKALTTELRAATPDAREIVRRSKGYK